MIQTLSANFLLQRHNLEMYLMELIEPKLPFLNVFPTSQNDTGEFATVLKQPTAAQDTANKIMGEPLDTAELSELTEIQISPLSAILGRTSAIGYQFKYSQKFKNRSDSDARLQLALSKIGAGMAMKIQALIMAGVLNSASAVFPAGLSDWSDVSTIDPRIDARKIRRSFNLGSDPTVSLPFNMDTAFVGYEAFDSLSDYYTSMDYPFDATGINVDGTKFIDVKNAFDLLGVDEDFVGIDSTIPCGIVEKYVDPDYSTIQKSIEQGPQNQVDIPLSLININQYKELAAPHNNVVEIWAELGFSGQEPLGAMAGTLASS
jgi:hypothetical protein